MSTSIELVVTVEVTGFPEPSGADEYGRTDEDFAVAAVWAASLRESQYLDGFADLDGVYAQIEYVEPL